MLPDLACDFVGQELNRWRRWLDYCYNCSGLAWLVLLCAPILAAGRENDDKNTWR